MFTQRILTSFIILSLCTVFFLGMFSIAQMNHTVESGQHTCPVAQVLNFECVGDSDVMTMINAHVSVLKGQLMTNVAVTSLALLVLVIAVMLIFFVPPHMLSISITRVYDWADRYATMRADVMRWMRLLNKGDIPANAGAFEYSRR